MLAQDGRLSHGEMEAGDGVIMLATPSSHYHGPQKHRAESKAARLWSEVPYIIDCVLGYVDDVDRHFARAQAADATMFSPVEKAPNGKRYRAEDIEGHRWMFLER